MLIDIISQGKPPKCTGDIELILFFFNASLILLIEMLPVSSSISANTTSPPVNIEEFAVDANEIGDVSNFFPFVLFEMIEAKCNPAVQLDTTTAYFEPTYFEINFSNLLINGPWVRKLLFKTFLQLISPLYLCDAFHMVSLKY